VVSIPKLPMLSMNPMVSSRTEDYSDVDRVSAACYFPISVYLGIAFRPVVSRFRHV
jgi:hypothetical protein